MSLRDLLPQGTYDSLLQRSGRGAEHAQPEAPAPGGVLMVSCPTCGRRVAYAPDNCFRPFCSLRCKYLDLGAWADGRRVLPGEEQDPEAQVPPPHPPCP